MIDLGLEARKTLGLQYVLEMLTPASPYGAERVRQLRFYMPGEREALVREWENVRAATTGLTNDASRYDRLRHLLMQTRDIRETLRRCRESTLTEVELFEVKRFLLQLSLIVPLFSELGTGYREIAFTKEEGALKVLDPDGRGNLGFSIGGTKKLAAVREEKRRVERALRDAPGGTAREALLIERRALAAREEEEADRVRDTLSRALRPYLDALLQNTDMAGRLDFTLAKAALALRWGAVMPKLSDGALRFVGMENPCLADMCAKQGRAFTRVTVEAPPGVTVITGANMGGKSVALKTLVLNALLCQAGFFAFADEAHTPLFDEIYVIGEEYVGVQAGLSSFGAEVICLREMLVAVESGTRCLVAMDEPARGTNPQEGAALVHSLARCLAKSPSVAVIATHFDGVAAHAGAHYQASGLSGLPDTAPAGDLPAFIASHMNYGLVRVANEAETPREALTICRLLGLRADVLHGMERELTRGNEDC